jgi:hypothetical protein
MLTIPSLKLTYIHIPRTGGTALKAAIYKSIPDVVFNRNPHASARHSKVLAGGDYRAFTVLRNPIDIYASQYRLVRRLANECVSWPIRCKDDELFHNHLFECATKSFTTYIDFILQHATICSVGGFYSTYCMPDTIIFKYEENFHARVEELLGCHLELEKVNCGCEGVDTTYTDELKTKVQDFCRYDYEMGFYKR